MKLSLVESTHLECTTPKVFDPLIRFFISDITVGWKKFMGKVYDGIHRVTYVIDEEGIVIKRFDKVKTKEHTEQILEALNLN